MSRLFVTNREINFISDITKEVIKDIVGSKVRYYPISELKTKTHKIYNESPEKIFDNPIEIEALVSSPETEITAGKIGYEQNWTLEAYVQSRDLIQKEIKISVGDFFSYGSMMFEIVSYTLMRNIYGQVEHDDGYKIIGQNVRESQFKDKFMGPTGDEFLDIDAIQETFVQQRGLEGNRNGDTNDIRDLQKNGVLDKPISGPAEISKEPSEPNSAAGPSFYDEK